MVDGFIYNFKKFNRKKEKNNFISSLPKSF